MSKSFPGENVIYIHQTSFETSNVYVGDKTGVKRRREAVDKEKENDVGEEGNYNKAENLCGVP